MRRIAERVGSALIERILAHVGEKAEKAATALILPSTGAPVIA